MKIRRAFVLGMVALALMLGAAPRTSPVSETWIAVSVIGEALACPGNGKGWGRGGSGGRGHGKGR